MRVANKELSRRGAKFLQDQSALFTAAFQTLQAVIRDERLERSSLRLLQSSEELLTNESVRRHDIAKLEKFHFSKMWLSEKVCLLSWLERMQRLKLFRFHSVILEEKCHRWIVIEAQQLDLRLAILHIACIEHNRLVLAARRWEEVFSDAYASPTRILRSLSDERFVVRQLLDVLSDAELNQRAPPNPTTGSQQQLVGRGTTVRVSKDGAGGEGSMSSSRPRPPKSTSAVSPGWRHTYK